MDCNRYKNTLDACKHIFEAEEDPFKASTMVSKGTMVPVVCCYEYMLYANLYPGQEEKIKTHIQKLIKFYGYKSYEGFKDE